MKWVEEHPDVGNMGTSGRMIPQPDCRVKNKTLGFAGLGNAKKTDEKKWKSIQTQTRDQFRIKWTQGAERTPGTTGKQTNALHGHPVPTTQVLLGPAPRASCPPQVIVSPTQAEVVGGLGVL